MRRWLSASDVVINISLLTTHRGRGVATLTFTLDTYIHTYMAIPFGMVSDEYLMDDIKSIF